MFSTSLEPAPATWVGFEHLALTLTVTLTLALTLTLTVIPPTLTVTLTRFEHLTCLAPRLPTPSTLPTTTAAGYKSISTRVLVSVNGVLAEARAPGMTF